MDKAEAVEILELRDNFTTPQIYYAFESKKNKKSRKKIIQAKIILLRERVLKSKQSGKKFKPKVAVEVCEQCFGTCEVNYEFQYEEIKCPICSTKKRGKKKCWKCKDSGTIKFPIKIKKAEQCPECAGKGVCLL